jgi:hypothetical protein
VQLIHQSLHPYRRHSGGAERELCHALLCCAILLHVHVQLWLCVVHVVVLSLLMAKRWLWWFVVCGLWMDWMVLHKASPATLVAQGFWRMVERISSLNYIFSSSYHAISWWFCKFQLSTCQKNHSNFNILMLLEVEIEDQTTIDWATLTHPLLQLLIPPSPRIQDWCTCYNQKPRFLRTTQAHCHKRHLE